METSLSACAEFLVSHDNFLLYTHAAPDADTLGSAFALAYALKKIGKKVLVFNPDPIPGRLTFLFEDGETPVLHTLPEGVFTHVSVDIASFAMLRGLDEKILENLVFDLSIDHHAVNTVKTKRLLCLPDYCATGEIVAKIIGLLNVPLDRRAALWLYAAVSSDSGCFRYSSTRPETHLLAARLLETGIDFAGINRRLFERKTKGQLALEKDAYDHMERFFGGRVAVVTLSEAVLSLPFVDSADLEQINNIPRQIEGVEVSALIRRQGDEIKVSLRSNDYYDVAALAKSFGGGGHLHAAGCRFDTDVKDAKEKIINALEKEFHEA